MPDQHPTQAASNQGLIPASGRLPVVAAFYVPIALLVALMFAAEGRELQGAVGLAMMLLLAAAGVPIAVAMGTAGALGVWAIRDVAAMASTLATAPFGATASWSLSVLPMFIFMGFILYRAGATTHMYRAARQWLSWLPNGLAITTNFAGAGLAAVSGSTVGITYALGRIGIPEMLRAGYDRRIAVASVLLAGTIGNLIPPSILLVIYAGIATVPVGPQLLAGMAPGLVLALVYGLALYFVAVVAPHMAPRASIPANWGDRLQSLAMVTPLGFLVVLVLGGIYSGVFTPTEAGAYGAFGALLTALLYMKGKGFFTMLGQALWDTLASAASILFLLMGATILNRMLALSNIPAQLTGFIQDLDLSRVQFALIALVMYLILGMFMDAITMMLLTVPLLLPIATSLGISALWFGVFVVLLGELAIITPPIGILAFILHGLVQDPEVSGDTRISLGDVFQAAFWFLPAAVAVLILLIFVPQLAEWLPAWAVR